MKNIRPSMKPSSVGLKRALKVAAIIALKMRVGPGEVLLTQLLGLPAANAAGRTMPHQSPSDRRQLPQL